MPRIGFLINPIAGMGGRVGLKGTNGVAAEAVRRGAQPTANTRALEALCKFKHLLDCTLNPPAIEWLTATGSMGRDALQIAGFTAVEVVYATPIEPSARDTRPRLKFLPPASASSCSAAVTDRARHLSHDEPRPSSGFRWRQNVFWRVRRHPGANRRYTDATPMKSGSPASKSLIWTKTNIAATNGRSGSTCRRGRRSNRPTYSRPRR
jgi:hypothetical protein